MSSPLLLSVLASFLLSSMACKGVHNREFRIDVDILGASVKNCFLNCSSPHDICRCSNMSQEMCNSPHYAIKALGSFHPKISHQTKPLMRALSNMTGSCQLTSFCSLPVLLSPKSLHEKLKELSERIESVL